MMISGSVPSETAAHVAHTGTAGSHRSESINFWRIDSHAVPVGWSCVNFLLLVWILRRATRTKLKNAFAARSDRIKESVHSSGVRYERARDTHARACQNSAGLQKKLQQISEDTQLKASDLLKNAQNQADEQTQRVLQAAHKRCLQEERTALQRVRVQSIAQVFQDIENRLKQAFLHKPGLHVDVNQQAITAFEKLPAGLLMNDAFGEKQR